MLHFDHNATTPLLPAAREAWLLASDDHWHNPSGPGRASARARFLLEECREKIARAVSAEPSRVVLTSGGTEAANGFFAALALRSAPASQVVISPFEHSCVQLSAQRWFPGRVVHLKASAKGLCDLSTLPELLRSRNIAAVSLMAVHNETGVVQPWREALTLCRAADVPLACDACQWFGKLPADGLEGCDFVFSSAHKFHGGKGVGFALWSESLGGTTLAEGGGQESGRRSGTPSLPAATAMAAALTDRATLSADAAHREQLASARDQFEAAILDGLPGSYFPARGCERLWNTSFLLLPPGSDNLRWVLKLDKKGFAVGTGSACSSLGGGSSRTLSALGLPPSDTSRTLRFSGGWETATGAWGSLAAACLSTARELAAEHLKA